jgi:hypothetical protein
MTPKDNLDSTLTVELDAESLANVHGGLTPLDPSIEIPTIRIPISPWKDPVWPRGGPVSPFPSPAPQPDPVFKSTGQTLPIYPFPFV